MLRNAERSSSLITPRLEHPREPEIYWTIVSIDTKVWGRWPLSSDAWDGQMLRTRA